MTEDMTQPMVIVDKWTILHAIIVVAAVAIFYIGTKKKYEEYAITYFVNDEVYKTVKYRYDEEIEAIEAPKEEGKVFSGWNRELPDKMPKNNIEVRGTLK